MIRILAAALVALPALAAAQLQPPSSLPAPPRAIRVSGEGEVSIRPDVAVVMAGVESTGKDVAKVTADVNAQMRKVQQALAALGVAERDVQTTRHDIQVNRQWKDGSPGPITGYTVADEVRVKVRDLAKLGAVLDRVVAAGSNSLRALSFEKDDPAPARRDALGKAVGDARAKAEAIAKAAGVALGELVSVQEAVVGPRPVMYEMRAAKGMDQADAPVSPGEITVGAQVEATFAIR